MKVFISMGSLNEYCLQRIQELEQRFPNIAFDLSQDSRKRNSALSDAEVLVTGSLKIEELEVCTKLKAIFVPFTGINKLPLKELKDRGIVVCNSHGKAKLIAERAMALTMSLLGRVVEMHNLMKDDGVWLTRKNWGREYWTSLCGKRCGIYGAGSIGKEIIKLLKPFDCEIIALDRDNNKELADVYVKDLQELVQTSDIVFVCVPLTQETMGSIDSSILGEMHDKFIINIARGEIIDELSLYQALRDGTLKGAGLDVWYKYPKPPFETPSYGSKYPIHSLINVVMSPHAAAHAEEFKNGYHEDILNQLEYYLETNKFLRTVDIGKRL